MEMEVAADGKARRAIGNQSVDSENGIGESDVGTSADRSELQLKIGIRLSPRTVAKYMPKPGAGPWSGVRSQSWRTLWQNHAKEIVACDFFTVVTASLKVFYVHCDGAC
jgi:hypothetical protein